MSAFEIARGWRVRFLTGAKYADAFTATGADFIPLPADADTLDEVMDELDALRTGGRSVGLVSHLAELRTRVPARLSVVRSPDGSRLADS